MAGKIVGDEFIETPGNENEDDVVIVEDENLGLGDDDTVVEAPAAPQARKKGGEITDDGDDFGDDDDDSVGAGLDSAMADAYAARVDALESQREALASRYETVQLQVEMTSTNLADHTAYLQRLQNPGRDAQGNPLPVNYQEVQRISDAIHALKATKATQEARLKPLQDSWNQLGEKIKSIPNPAAQTIERLQAKFVKQFPAMDPVKYPKRAAALHALSKQLVAEGIPPTSQRHFDELRNRGRLKPEWADYLKTPQAAANGGVVVKPHVRRAPQAVSRGGGEGRPTAAAPRAEAGAGKKVISAALVKQLEADGSFEKEAVKYARRNGVPLDAAARAKSRKEFLDQMAGYQSESMTRLGYTPKR